jgi:hypothetical protein
MRARPMMTGILFAWAILLIEGCGPMSAAPPAEKAIPLEVLYSGSHCGPQSRAPGAVWINRPADLPALANHPPTASFQWNPEMEGALWIYMGTQPTGGFGLELAAPTAIVQQAAATVRVHWRRPSPDRFVTQALTSPCLLLKLPKDGLKTIKIVDQDGQPRGQVQIPR